jgi:hypothetical protein
MERAKYVLSAVAAVVFAGVVTVSTTALAQEPATPVACGQVLTSSVRVANGLSECPGDGLIVGAADITIDLDGRTRDGTGLGAGVLNAGFDGVTITNGTIQDFDFGVLLQPGTGGNEVSNLSAELSQEAGIMLVGADRATWSAPTRSSRTHSPSASTTAPARSYTTTPWRPSREGRHPRHSPLRTCCARRCCRATRRSRDHGHRRGE